MLQFQPITLTDKAWIDPLVRMSGFRGSEYTFSNNFNYRAIYHIEVARMQDYYLLRAGKEKAQTGYFYPAGSGDVKPVIEALVADAEALGVPFVMRGVEKESVAATPSTTFTKVKSSSPCQAKSCTQSAILSTGSRRSMKGIGATSRSPVKTLPNAGR